MDREQEKKNIATRRDDVLQQYALGQRSPERLQEWVARYPEFEDDLVAFTVRGAMMDWLAEAEDDADGDPSSEASHLVQYGMDRLTRIIEDVEREGDADNEVHEPHAAAPADTQDNEADTLADLLRGAGHKPKAVMAAAGLSFVLLGKFNRGLITFPAEAVREEVARAIARAAGLSVTIVAQQLRRGARFGRGTYFAEDKPQVQTQDFFEAVRADPLLSSEQKQRWLALQS